MSSSAAIVCSSALALVAAYGASATKAVRPPPDCPPLRGMLTISLPPAFAGAGLSSSSSCVCVGALAMCSALAEQQVLTKRVKGVPSVAQHGAISSVLQWQQ